MPELQRYVVAGPAAMLRPLLDLLQTNPENVVHEVRRNAQGDPERFDVSLDPVRCDALTTVLAGTPVLIEPDLLLDL